MQNRKKYNCTESVRGFIAKWVTESHFLHTLVFLLLYRQVYHNIGNPVPASDNTLALAPCSFFDSDYSAGTIWVCRTLQQSYLHLHASSTHQTLINIKRCPIFECFGRCSVPTCLAQVETAILCTDADCHRITDDFIFVRN